MSRKAVFLDRDGTLNREVHYLSNPKDFAWLPTVRAGLAALQAAGWALVVVTNQSGIAQGMLEVEDLEAIHARMERELEEVGVRLDGVYWCPHHPNLGRAPWVHPCECRKPAPGMLRTAQADLDLDLGSSWVIGDSLRDLEAGWAVGCQGILVQTGKGPEAAQQLDAPTAERVHVAANFQAAAERILGRSLG